MKEKSSSSSSSRLHKMYLLHENEFDKYKDEIEGEKYLSKLDKDMKMVLRNKRFSPYKKWTLYNQILTRYSTYKKYLMEQHRAKMANADSADTSPSAAFDKNNSASSSSPSSYSNIIHNDNSFHDAVDEFQTPPLIKSLREKNKTRTRDAGSQVNASTREISSQVTPYRFDEKIIGDSSSPRLKLLSMPASPADDYDDDEIMEISSDSSPNISLLSPSALRHRDLERTMASITPIARLNKSQRVQNAFRSQGGFPNHTKMLTLKANEEEGREEEKLEEIVLPKTKIDEDFLTTETKDGVALSFPLSDLYVDDIESVKQQLMTLHSEIDEETKEIDGSSKKLHQPKYTIDRLEDGQFAISFKNERQIVSKNVADFVENILEHDRQTAKNKKLKEIVAQAKREYTQKMKEQRMKQPSMTSMLSTSRASALSTPKISDARGKKRSSANLTTLSKAASASLQPAQRKRLRDVRTDSPMEISYSTRATSSPLSTSASHSSATTTTTTTPPKSTKKSAKKKSASQKSKGKMRSTTMDEHMRKTKAPFTARSLRFDMMRDANQSGKGARIYDMNTFLSTWKTI